MSGDLRDPHGEGGLVDVFGCGVRGVEGEFGAGFAETGSVLCGGVDGDGEDLACGCLVVEVREGGVDGRQGRRGRGFGWLR